MKLKNITYISAFILLASLSLFSCSKQLAEINENPNSTSNPDPAYLLTGVEKTAATNYWGSTANYSGTQLITQQWARIQYTDLDRYIYTNSTFTSFWNNILSYHITALDDIINIGRNTNNNNYVAVGHVLRAWEFQLLTDVFGDVPYSQVNKIDSFATQKYDTQQDIYHSLINELDSALTLFDVNGTPIEGDRIYSNSITKWQKFANGLKIRIALRIADREPDFSKKWINEAIQSGKIMESNADNATFIFSSSPNWNPVAEIFSTREDSRISANLVNTLENLNDPRLPIYADLPTDTSIYIGVPNGLLVGDASKYGLYKTSRPGAYFRADAAPAVILTFSELQFALAEAVERGFISGDAASFYNNGITASFNQYGIESTSDINEYLSQSEVKYNPTNYKKSIGQQKWIALFGQGIECFSEWRRLDYPVLTPAVAGVLNGAIPVRFIYPGTEQTLNKANYTAAVAHQGTDNLLTKLWFDVF